MQRWIAARIEQIHRNVTAHDVLRRNRVRLRQGGSELEEQFSCPFHGADNTPSCRVYASSPRSPSHVWCFVCRERWDAISLWKKFAGYEGGFTFLLTQIERDFGLTAPETPEEVEEEKDDTERNDVILLFDVCERRLKGAKNLFNMRTFLGIGSILDRLWYGFEEGTQTCEQARVVLQKVLVKIGEKEQRPL